MEKTEKLLNERIKQLEIDNQNLKQSLLKTMQQANTQLLQEKIKYDVLLNNYLKLKRHTAYLDLLCR